MFITPRMVTELTKAALCQLGSGTIVINVRGLLVNLNGFAWL